MDVYIISSLAALCNHFTPAFTAPSFSNFLDLVVAWIRCEGRYTISRVLVAGSYAEGKKHHAAFYRFFSRAVWKTDALGHILFQLLLPWIPESIIWAIVDDSLARRHGPRVWGAAMHHDPLASTYGRGTSHGRHTAFAFGHNFVVLAIWVPLPWNLERGVAIPVLARLYRGKKRCPASQYRKRTDLAADLLSILAGWLPEDRELRLVGDAEYANRTLVPQACRHGHFVGPVPMDAALYARPPRQRSPRRKGRPRNYGRRLSNPHALANDPRAPWESVKARLYGRDVRIRIKTRVCLWPTVAGTRPIRLVITDDPRNLLARRVFFSTRSQDTPTEILQTFARRWSLEVTFRDAKQHLGLEDPQNGWGRRGHNSGPRKKKPGPDPRGNRGRKAAERTGPFVLLLYGLIHLWYFEHGNPDETVQRVRRRAPWYRHKHEPSFADMVETLRLELVATYFSQDPAAKRVLEKTPDLTTLIGTLLPGFKRAA